MKEYIKNFSRGVKSGTKAMRPLFILNFWVFLSLGVVCLALIPIEKGNALSILLIALYDFAVAAVMWYAVQKTK